MPPSRMKTVRGDLLVLARRGDFDVIAHGCNCFCAMGAGIALQIKREHPEAYKADLQTSKGDPRKLGTCSAAVITTPTSTFTIVNAYIQLHWAGKLPLVDENALRSCMRWLHTHHAGQRIGLPLIGAGLAGGDWNSIARIIVDELATEDVTVVEFDRFAVE